MCCDGENSLRPPFLSQWKREKDCGTVPVTFQSWAGLRTERSFQIHLSGFGDDRGNPVKGQLSTFDGFCYNMPSVHVTVDKCFHWLDQITIADHCLGLSILAFPACLLGTGMSFWHIPILKSHLPLPGWSVSILLFCIHAGKIKRECFRERCHQSSGGIDDSYKCNWDIYFLSQCSRELKMKLRGRVTL